MLNSEISQLFGLVPITDFKNLSPKKYPILIELGVILGVKYTNHLLSSDIVEKMGVKLKQTIKINFILIIANIPINIITLSYLLKIDLFN